MSMFEKFKEIIGGGDYDEDFDDIDEVEEEEEEVEEVEPIISKQRGNKVVNIHNSASAKVMVVKPASYDEAREIAEAIKNRKIVVVNTTAMETKIAQRLVDFISGACCVLGAQLQEVEQRVYLLSPSNVEVSNELRTEISSKALFNWNKYEVIPIGIIGSFLYLLFSVLNITILAE